MPSTARLKSLLCTSAFLTLFIANCGETEMVEEVDDAQAAEELAEKSREAARHERAEREAQRALETQERLRKKNLVKVGEALEKIKNPDLEPVSARWALFVFDNAEDPIPEDQLPMATLLNLYSLGKQFKFPSMTFSVPEAQRYKLPEFNAHFLDYIASRVTETNREVFYKASTRREDFARMVLSKDGDQFLKQFEANPDVSHFQAALNDGAKKGLIEIPFLLKTLAIENIKVQEAAMSGISSLRFVPPASLPILREFYSRCDDRYSHQTNADARSALRKGYGAKLEEQLKQPDLDPEVRALLSAIKELVSTDGWRKSNPLTEFLEKHPQANPDWPPVTAELDFIASESLYQKWMVDAYAKLGGTSAVEYIRAYSLQVTGPGLDEVYGKALFEIFKKDPKAGKKLYLELSEREGCHLSLVIMSFGETWESDPNGVRKEHIQALVDEKLPSAHNFSPLLKRH